MHQKKFKHHLLSDLKEHLKDPMNQVLFIMGTLCIIAILAMLLWFLWYKISPDSAPITLWSETFQESMSPNKSESTEDALYFGDYINDPEFQKLLTFSNLSYQETRAILERNIPNIQSAYIDDPDHHQAELYTNPNTTPQTAYHLFTTDTITLLHYDDNLYICTNIRQVDDDIRLDAYSLQQAYILSITDQKTISGFTEFLNSLK